MCIYFINLLCCYIILIIHFCGIYMNNETSFLLFLYMFPQYASSSPPPYQFHGCNCDLLSFSLSLPFARARERRPLKFQP